MAFDPTLYAETQINQGTKPELLVPVDASAIPDIQDFVADEIARGNKPQVVIFYYAGEDAIGPPSGDGSVAATSYQLAGTPNGSGIALASGQVSPATIVDRADYKWDAEFTGDGLALQVMASDGFTWRTVSVLTEASTDPNRIALGQGNQVRVYNPTAYDVTSIYSSLS